MKPINVARTALLAGACLMAASQSHAATFTDLDNTILMEGAIEFGDDAKLAATLNSRNTRGIETVGILLDSPGGYLQPASDMAKMIRADNLATGVASNDECVSACVLMLVAGTKRYVGESASIGVHSAGDDNGEAKAETVTLVREMASYGAPAAIIAKLVTTSNDDVAYLGFADVDGWAEVMPDKEETAPVEQAYAAPDNPSSYSMTCRSTASGVVYPVYKVGATQLQVHTKLYTIVEQHQHSGTGAYVISGNTPYGTFGAVFGGPNPRMNFANSKETAVDRCW